MPRKTRKTLAGPRCKWEPQPVEEGYGIEGTPLKRGSRISIGTNNDTHGTVLGISDSGLLVGIKFDDCEFVTEYTLEQFVSRFS